MLQTPNEESGNVHEQFLELGLGNRDRRHHVVGQNDHGSLDGEHHLGNDIRSWMD